MIKIQDLTFTYPGAHTPNLQKVTLDIEKGDFLAIVGNNGCGKSTLCKSLIGLIPHFISGDMEGEILVQGKNTKEMNIGEIASKIGYVYQDFENQIVRPTVLDDVSYACLNYAMEDYQERGRQALLQCGLRNREKDYIWQLSGGQKHLLALAGGVALNPDILILDEPIAQLDPAHAMQIYEVLKELNEVHHKTIIVIEHHTEFIAQYCSHVVLMKEGHIQWKKEAKDAMRQVEELLDSNIFPPQVTMAARQLIEEKLLPSNTQLPVTLEEAAHCFSTLKWNQYKAIRPHESSYEINVYLDRVGVSYRAVKGDAHSVFQDFSLALRKKEKIALIGSNGAGKSTLMKLMIGLLKPSSGKVLLCNKDTREYGADDLSQIISMVYQNPEEMFIKDSIREDIAYAMKERKVENYDARVEELLETFRLTDIAHRDGRLLSGGQMRRASLAIGVALFPQILLLDEPTANLDIATRKEVMNLLKTMKDLTDTVMIATHDMQLVCEWAERVIVISRGEIVADGSVESVFGKKEIMDMVGIKAPDIYEAAKQVDSGAFAYTVEDFVKGTGGLRYDERAV